MKKLKSWVRSRGGLATILITTGIILLGLSFLTIGYVYAYLDGNWARLSELFTSKVMTTIYIISGLLLFCAIFVIVIIKQTKEIK